MFILGIILDSFLKLVNWRGLAEAGEERIRQLRLRNVRQLRARSFAPVFVSLSEELVAIAIVNAWLHESAGERIVFAHYLEKLQERSLRKEMGEGPYLLCVISNTDLAIVRVNPAPGWQARIDRRKGYASGRVFRSVREGNTKTALEWREEG